MAVCEDHGGTDGPSHGCGTPTAVHPQVDCRNGIYRNQGESGSVLSGEPELLALVISSGASLPSPDAEVHLSNLPASYHGEVRSTNPVAGRFTVPADVGTRTAIVDDTVSGVETTRS